MYFPATEGCRDVHNYERLNRIDEGQYGVVYRAKDKLTSAIVALKRLKMEKEKEGFPITSLREINCLLRCKHPNIVNVREIVVGSGMDDIYIVMDYVEHDLKALMSSMKEPFKLSETKMLLMHLLRGVEHMHKNWILHRDLKPSNLLLSNNGVLKIGDFGLAREYGDPLKPYTPLVVTLWYRCPELLLGEKMYSTAVDLWSVGCIFSELLLNKVLLKGTSEVAQLDHIFTLLGRPSQRDWPDYDKLPNAKMIKFGRYSLDRYALLKEKFHFMSESGINLLKSFLCYNPKTRISASEALGHFFFKQHPKPSSSALFPTFPARSKGERRQLDTIPAPAPHNPLNDVMAEFTVDEYGTNQTKNK
ncbi:cyclin-dependent kinase 11B-like [Zophobas morio]|uniref:cyclin-dependent kinase 11B-like n=1 Tax=Zophobas morio TaxID=2755281 RepID=UPI003083C4BF